MRIAFIHPEMEYLGIEYLSSVLKNGGHNVRLFFDPQLFSDTVSKSSFLSRVFDYQDKLVSELKCYSPDLVAFSLLSTNYQWAYALARRIKKELPVPLVFGGIHATAMPDEVVRNEFVDYVIMGEGESAFLDLANALSQKKAVDSIENLCTKVNGNVIKNKLRPPVRDLDELPFPDKGLFYDAMPYLQESYTLVTGRGCPHNCSYCCSGFISGLYENKFLRRRSVQNVIAELTAARGRYSIKRIFFDDSTFTYDKKWLSEFAAAYKEKIGLPSFCWVHPNDVDADLIGLLKMINCKAVEMGVETLDEKVRAGLLNRHYTNIMIQDAIGLFNRNRIFCVVDNIKGFYDTPEKEMADFVNFYNENRPGKIYIFEYRPFPKTRLSEIGQKQGPAPAAEAELAPFTISTKKTGSMVKKMEILLVLSYFLPRPLIKYLLDKKMYRFFPPVSTYNILEIFPYFLNLVRRRHRRFWYPIRGTRRRYLHYLVSNMGYFLNKPIKLWG